MKTNRRDARTLCEACELGVYRPAHRSAEASRVLRAQVAVSSPASCLRCGAPAPTSDKPRLLNVGEAFCRSYYQEYALPYTIFRFFNTYGPLQSTDFVISKFIRAARRGEDVTIYGDGSQTRTFCHIDDNVDATLICLSDRDSINDTLNIGHATEISILDLARLVIRKTGSKSKIVHLPPLEAGDMTRRQPNNAKMLKLLGRPLIDLQTGLDMLLEDNAFCARLDET